MKLRMRGGSVRLRLTQSEVAQFARTGLVEETVAFPSASLTYQLRRADPLAADLSAGMLIVSVPETIARQWTETAQVGIEAQVAGIDILIEKDFQCAHGPADLDAFDPDRL